MDQVVAGVVEMAGQGRSTQCGCICEQLLDAVGFHGVVSWGIAKMGAGLPAIAPGQHLQLEQLSGGYTVAHVAEGGTDPQAAGGQAIIEKLKDLVAFLEVGSFTAPALSFSAIRCSANVLASSETVERFGAGELMGHCLTVVHLVFPLPRLVPLVDIGAVGADLQIQDGGPAIAQGELVGPGPVVVPVGVDEPGRDHMAGGVDRLLACDLFLGDDGDPAVLDADVGDGVVLGFRVHDPAIQNDQVIVFGHGGQRYCKCQNKPTECVENLFHFVTP